MSASVFNSIRKEEAKYQAWVNRIYAAVGSEKFRKIPLSLELGYSIGHMEKVLTAMKELGMVRKTGGGRSMWWNLREKICQNVLREENQ